MHQINNRISNILDELILIQKSDQSIFEKSDPLHLLRTIPVNEFESLQTNKKIDENIIDLANYLYAEKSLASTFTAEEFLTIVSDIFGSILGKIDLDLSRDQNIASVYEKLILKLNNYKSQLATCEYSFGCMLFDNVNIKSFTIGPVRFEPRLEWLQRKVNSGNLSEITYEQIKRAWLENKSTTDEIYVASIIDAIGDCAWVCCVDICEQGPEAAKLKAIKTARLAITSIALFFPDTSEILKSMYLRYDFHVGWKDVLISTEGKYLTASSTPRVKPHGRFIKSEKWEKLYTEQSLYFKSVGNVLEYFLNPNLNISNHKILYTLAQALIWFHEGCREDDSLISIVKLASSLDTLACGKGDFDIKKLIENRLGIRKEDRILSLNITMSNAIDQIYNYGRSRTLHGNNEKIRDDWSLIKNCAELLARRCLIKCIEWAASNPEINEPKLLSSKT
jgi:hypothetical protein